MSAWNPSLLSVAEGEPADGHLAPNDQENEERTTRATGREFACGPSALATARIIKDLHSVQYPEGILAPNAELNMNAPAGKFKYDRGFLLQFREICKEKPDDLPSLDKIGIKRRDRTRSKRGEKGSNSSSMDPPWEPVAPLKVTANRWVPTSTKRAAPADQESPEIVSRKVTALLNKLTMEYFDSISDQIIAWANKTEKEKDVYMLTKVVQLIFEAAVDQEIFSEMYARLCRKMMEMISSKVQDDGMKNAEGKPITGGLLFRKFLLNRCQEGVESGWDDKALSESKLYSDEYYAAAKAKRRNLGFTQFFGELFKLQILTERIVHKHIKELLSNVETPDGIECLCRILMTVGQTLDTPKARTDMRVYFSRVEELYTSCDINSRTRFMLLDIIELRGRQWVPRTRAASSMTIAETYKMTAVEKAVQDRGVYERQRSMPGGGSRRGGNRGGGESHIGPDGWAVTWNAPSRAPVKAGDLSHFGKINKAQPMTFGPSGVFAGKKDLKATGQERPISRTASTSNMFLALSGNPVPSRMPSVDQAGAPNPPKRHRLQLLPRLKLVDEIRETLAGSETEDAAAAATAGVSMSGGDAKKQIQGDAKEFFSIRSIDEAENYFSALPSAHHFRLVDKLAMQAVESKATDAELVANFFKRAREKDLCTPAAFEEGFMPLAEIIDDVAIDAPKALELFAVMVKGAGLHEDEEQRTRIAEKSMDSAKLQELFAASY